MMIPLLYSLISLYLLVGVVYFAHRRKGYSHVRHTISELGEIGTPVRGLVGYGLFLPVGGALLLAGLLVYPRTSTAMSYPVGGLSVSVGIGYIIAALFPCDKGSPISGSIRQQIHNFGGFIEYVGGAYFLIRAADSLPGSWFDVVGYAVLAGSILLSVSALFPWRGLIQRVAEICLFGTLVALSLH